MKKNLTHIGFIFLMSMVLTTTGCAIRKPKDDTPPVITNVPENTPIPENNDEEKEPDNKEPDDSEPATVVPVATKELSIYTFNETTFNVESVTALVPEEKELTPELVVDTVVLSFSDRMVEVGIDYVLGEGDTVIVSFTKEQAPFIDAGSGLEASILDSIAQSLVENFPEYPKVIFRVEDGAYESGHFEYGVDEVYLDGNRTN